jgi:serine/threonine protein kinase
MFHTSVIQSSYGAPPVRPDRDNPGRGVMPELPLVGDEFAGYRMRAVLGRGGMSVVYQAENLRLSNVIALKVLAPELASDDVFRARFLEESRIAASLNHPNVIPIYDMGQATGCCISRCGMSRGRTCGR